ncbi:PAS domain S-box protein [Telmatobacter sp. DSM 110680]|uniref:histidine kinase n=1 Tax=Telmatobacter sp. DSM 110680 TaxID=3036704 RepID=A0AAU7DFP8_9BACT
MSSTHESLQNPRNPIREIEPDGVRLKELLAQAPTAIAFLSGTDFRISYANDLYVRAMGRSTSSELLGRKIHEAVPELKDLGILEMLNDVYRTGDAHHETDFKLTLHTASPEHLEHRYFDFILQPTFDVAGKFEGVFVLAVDLTDRVLSRRAVEVSEERLRLAQEAAQIGTWEWDPVENTRTLSKQMHRMYGTDSKATNEEIHKTWISRVLPRDLPYVNLAMAECQRTGLLDLEYRYNHPEMGLRHHHSKGRRMLGTSRFFGVVSDITDRKRLEESLSEREQEFRSLANSMPQLVWMAGPDGYVHWFNERWYDYTGTTAEQNCGWGWQSALDPGYLPQLIARWTKSLESGEPFEMIFPLKGKEDTYKPFLTRAVPIYDSSGAVTRWFGTNTDLSGEFEIQQKILESKTREQASLEDTQRLAAIVESSDDSIISKDLNGIVKSWNPGAERVFGYTTEEMIGQSIRKIIPPELFSEEDRILSAVARGERTDHFETMRIRKDGEKIEVSLTLSPVADESGKITGVASISRDVSQQKKVERALHTSERLATVGRLAATIAHEINNPLEAVTNLVFLAQTSMQDEDGKIFLEQAQQELARMALLTKQTLGFYRENRGARPLTLGELVTPLVAVFSARARNKQVSIATDIRDNPTMVGFPGELRQLFANLLNNSIDAVRDHGRILIRVSAAHEYVGEKRAGVRLTVCDNGPGIAFEVRQKLFEPFFTTKRDVGTGLGLWVTSNILRKHNGTIRVRSSVTSGKSWTVFSVFLPLHSEPAVASA